MFWSPAVTTLSVTTCCAVAGIPQANAASAADMTVIRCVTASLELFCVLSWIEMQRRCRQGDADCVTDRQTTLVVNQILPRSDADRVAVKAPWIRDLSDRPAQHQAAV